MSPAGRMAGDNMMSMVAAVSATPAANARPPFVRQSPPLPARPHPCTVQYSIHDRSSLSTLGVGHKRTDCGAGGRRGLPPPSDAALVTHFRPPARRWRCRRRRRQRSRRLARRLTLVGRARPMAGGRCCRRCVCGVLVPLGHPLRRCGDGRPIRGEPTGGAVQGSFEQPGHLAVTRVVAVYAYKSPALYSIPIAARCRAHYSRLHHGANVPTGPPAAAPAIPPKRRPPLSGFSYNVPTRTVKCRAIQTLLPPPPSIHTPSTIPSVALGAAVSSRAPVSPNDETGRPGRPSEHSLYPGPPRRDAAVEERWVRGGSPPAAVADPGPPPWVEKGSAAPKRADIERSRWRWWRAPPRGRGGQWSTAPGAAPKSHVGGRRATGLCAQHSLGDHRLNVPVAIIPGVAAMGGQPPRRVCRGSDNSQRALPRRRAVHRVMATARAPPPPPLAPR